MAVWHRWAIEQMSFERVTCSTDIRLSKERSESIKSFQRSESKSPDIMLYQDETASLQKWKDALQGEWISLFCLSDMSWQCEHL